jgi:hypothetical protein
MRDPVNILDNDIGVQIEKKVLGRIVLAERLTSFVLAHHNTFSFAG